MLNQRTIRPGEELKEILIKSACAHCRASLLREQILSETIYSKRPSELKLELCCLDLYLECVTSSSCYWLYRVMENIRYLSSMRIQALIKAPV
jgi:hypothetical protein